MIEREYYPLEKAAKILGCEVDDLVHLGAKNKIHLFISPPRIPSGRIRLTNIAPKIACIPGEECVYSRPIIGSDGSDAYVWTEKREFKICATSGIFRLSPEYLRILEFHQPVLVGELALIGSDPQELWYILQDDQPLLGTEQAHIQVFRIDLLIKHDDLVALKSTAQGDQKNGHTQQALQEPAQHKQAAKPIPIQHQQEEYILDALRGLGHDPMNLPKRIPGKSWVKSEVKKRLSMSGRTFDHAWERLRESLKIKEVN